MTNYDDYNTRRKKRRMKKNIQRLGILLFAVLAMLGVAWLVTFLIQAAGGKIESPASVVSSLPQSVPASSQPMAETVDNSAWNVVGPIQQEAGQMQLISPDYRMIALPENGRVSMEYFNTATFVGDSLTQGLELYKQQGIPNAHYCAYKGIGPKQIYDGSIQKRRDGEQEIPMDALVASQPDNVYILLGANSMVGMNDESVIAYYKEMLTQVKANLHPEVGIYIQSLTPVRPDNKPAFDMERIRGLNNQLAKMAWEESVYFVDLTEPLLAEDGFLREEFAGSDGYHLSPDGYSAWVEYLVTHTAYNARNPYLEGSPYAPIA